MYRSSYRWRNRSQNLTSTAARYYEPESAAEVQEIVREARRQGQRVRAVGDSHSWSPLAVTGGFLVSTRRMRRILSVSADPPRMVVEPGATVGETLRACLAHGVCLPMNVDIPTITIGGAVAVGANGFSRHWGAYSDFVEEVELVTGAGELRSVRRDRDGDLWRAVICSLGLFGIFTRITLALQPAFNVRVVNQPQPLEEALGGIERALTGHDYAQFFWFPHNRDATLQTGDVTDAPPTWTRAHELGKQLGGWLETGGTHLAKAALLAAPQLTPRFTALAGATMRPSDDVMRQPENMLLGTWINQMAPSLNASVSFTPGPGCANARAAWQILIDLLAEFERAGRYPASLAMNMRLFGRSEALLHRAVADVGDTICNIQITSFANPHWEEFQHRLMERWMELPAARPHWAKQYQSLPRIAEQLRAAYGPSLDAFLCIREEQRVDPDNLFVNPFLERVLVAPRCAGAPAGG